MNVYKSTPTLSTTLYTSNYSSTPIINSLFIFLENKYYSGSLFWLKFCTSTALSALVNTSAHLIGKSVTLQMSWWLQWGIFQKCNLFLLMFSLSFRFWFDGWIVLLWLVYFWLKKSANTSTIVFSSLLSSLTWFYHQIHVLTSNIFEFFSYHWYLFLYSPYNIVVHL